LESLRKVGRDGREVGAQPVEEESREPKKPRRTFKETV
jgi:hypothetical protein